jgi:hypothetical protein
VAFSSGFISMNACLLGVGVPGKGRVCERMLDVFLLGFF